MKAQPAASLFRKIRIPLIIALISAGILVGASLAYSYTSGPRNVPFHTLAYGYGATFYTATFYVVINDQLSLSSVWNKTTSCSAQSSCSPPNIDWNQRTVIAVFLGERGSSGYAINVTQITSSGSSLTVHVLASTPGSNCANLAIVTAPFHMVDIAKANGPISFSGTTQANNC